MNNFFIIVPTLNSYQLLPRLIDSLMEQTHEYWRVLFIDGDSNIEHKSFLNNLCLNNKKFDYINQIDLKSGIFGAMNQGLKYVKENEWVFFWGSDDWLENKNVLLKINKNLCKKDFENCDIKVFSARFFDNNNSKARRIFFTNSKIKYYNNKQFIRELFWGNTPPHQSTLFGPKILRKNINFDENLKIASDLLFFLKISHFKDLNLKVVDDQIINLGNSGVSSKNNSIKLKEVFYCYYKFFKILAVISFTARYLKKIFSKFNKL